MTTPCEPGITRTKTKSGRVIRLAVGMLILLAASYLSTVFFAGRQIAHWAARAPWRESPYSSPWPDERLLAVRLFHCLPQYEQELLDMLESGEQRLFGVAAARLLQIAPDLGVRSIERLQAIVSRKYDNE